MILNTGSRTDIPAFFSTWFYQRLRAGFVMVRNPYNPRQVTRYRLDPTVVDALVFCSKNPAPMLDDAAGFALLEPFDSFWFVTITPYGPEVEPNVPARTQVVETFRQLSGLVGAARTSWRYDPVFVDGRYTVDAHARAFEELAAQLEGATAQCVVSFIDLYEKVRRTFPEVRAVTPAEQEALVAAFAESAAAHGMTIHLCCENPALVRPGVDADGCLSQAVLEQAIGCGLRVPARAGARAACPCLLGADIGAYDTCAHGCRYCYANHNRAAVKRNLRHHDPASPFLIGGFEPGDVVHEADQRSWREPQMPLF